MAGMDALTALSTRSSRRNTDKHTNNNLRSLIGVVGASLVRGDTQDDTVYQGITKALKPGSSSIDGDHHRSTAINAAYDGIRSSLAGHAAGVLGLISDKETKERMATLLVAPGVLESLHFSILLDKTTGGSGRVPPHVLNSLTKRAKALGLKDSLTKEELSPGIWTKVSTFGEALTDTLPPSKINSMFAKLMTQWLMSDGKAAEETERKKEEEDKRMIEEEIEDEVKDKGDGKKEERTEKAPYNPEPDLLKEEQFEDGDDKKGSDDEDEDDIKDKDKKKKDKSPISMALKALAVNKDDNEEVVAFKRGVTATLGLSGVPQRFTDKMRFTGDVGSSNTSRALGISLQRSPEKARSGTKRDAKKPDKDYYPIKYTNEMKPHVNSSAIARQLNTGPITDSRMEAMTSAFRLASDAKVGDELGMIQRASMSRQLRTTEMMANMQVEKTRTSYKYKVELNIKPNIISERIPFRDIGFTEFFVLDRLSDGQTNGVDVIYDTMGRPVPINNKYDALSYMAETNAALRQASYGGLIDKIYTEKRTLMGEPDAINVVVRLKEKYFYPGIKRNTVSDLFTVQMTGAFTTPDSLDADPVCQAYGYRKWTYYLMRTIGASIEPPEKVGFPSNALYLTWGLGQQSLIKVDDTNFEMTALIESKLYPDTVAGIIFSKSEPSKMGQLMSANRGMNSSTTWDQYNYWNNSVFQPLQDIMRAYRLDQTIPLNRWMYKLTSTANIQANPQTVEMLTKQTAIVVNNSKIPIVNYNSTDSARNLVTVRQPTETDQQLDFLDRICNEGSDGSSEAANRIQHAAVACAALDTFTEFDPQRLTKSLQNIVPAKTASVNPAVTFVSTILQLAQYDKTTMYIAALYSMRPVGCNLLDDPSSYPDFTAGAELQGLSRAVCCIRGLLMAKIPFRNLKIVQLYIQMFWHKFRATNPSAFYDDESSFNRLSNPATIQATSDGPNLFRRQHGDLRGCLQLGELVKVLNNMMESGDIIPFPENGNGPKFPGVTSQSVQWPHGLAKRNTAWTYDGTATSQDEHNYRLVCDIFIASYQSIATYMGNSQEAKSTTLVFNAMQAYTPDCGHMFRTYIPEIASRQLRVHMIPTHIPFGAVDKMAKEYNALAGMTARPTSSEEERNALLERTFKEAYDINGRMQDLPRGTRARTAHTINELSQVRVSNHLDAGKDVIVNYCDIRTINVAQFGADSLIMTARGNFANPAQVVSTLWSQLDITLSAAYTNHAVDTAKQAAFKINHEVLCMPWRSRPKPYNVPPNQQTDPEYVNVIHERNEDLTRPIGPADPPELKRSRAALIPPILHEECLKMFGSDKTEHLFGTGQIDCKKTEFKAEFEYLGRRTVVGIHPPLSQTQKVVSTFARFLIDNRKFFPMHREGTLIGRRISYAPLNYYAAKWDGIPNWKRAPAEHIIGSKMVYIKIIAGTRYLCSGSATPDPTDNRNAIDLTNVKFLVITSHGAHQAKMLIDIMWDWVLNGRIQFVVLQEMAKYEIKPLSIDGGDYVEDLREFVNTIGIVGGVRMKPVYRLPLGMSSNTKRIITTEEHTTYVHPLKLLPQEVPAMTLPYTMTDVNVMVATGNNPEIFKYMYEDEPTFTIRPARINDPNDHPLEIKEVYSRVNIEKLERTEVVANAEWALPDVAAADRTIPPVVG